MFDQNAYGKQWAKDNKERINTHRRQSGYNQRAAKTRKDKEPLHSIITAIRVRSKKRAIPCDIDCAWGRQVWTGVCALTGIKLVSGSRGCPEWNSPSIDRIDPVKGYTRGNCRVIAFCINALKGSMSEDQFRQVIETIKAMP